MPIFKTHKAIFIHIPKTAGTSFVTALAPELHSYIANPGRCNFTYLYGRNLQHLTARKVKLLKPFKFSRYYKFAFVRNPWDRMLSEYNWRVKWDNSFKGVSFPDMIKKLPQLRKSGDPHFMSCSDFIFDRNGNLIIDYLGRFENLEVNFEEIAKNLNIKMKLPKKNVTKNSKSSSSYRSMYTPELAKIIETVYFDDVSNFNYSF